MQGQKTAFYIQRKAHWFHKLCMLTIVIVPFLSVIAAMWQLWSVYVGVFDLLLFVISYSLIAPGVTVGLHRYFTHASFQANRGVTFVLACLASLALEGPIIQWVANHRLHHQMADEPDDPHSPLDGLWHAHIGWIFSPKVADPEHYAKDLLKDRLIRYFSACFPLWVIISILSPFIIGGVVGGWFGIPVYEAALRGLIWGGLVRIFLVHHFTWSINSICHVWGDHPYDSGAYDQSGNVPLLALPTFGESWHGTHHAFPWSALHGTRWWNDPSFLIILVLAWFGWVWNVKVPNAKQYADSALRQSLRITQKETS